MSQRDPSALRFRPDGTFTIAQFTDLHWKDGGEADLRSRALMESVLEAEAVDLVVLTGDVLGGHKVDDPERAWLEAVEPFERRGVPWCAVFGNHDDEAGFSREDLMRLQLEAHTHCLTQRGPEDVPGVGNYVLEVAGTDEGSPCALALYCLDSLAYAWTAIGGYAWFRPAQIAWFRAQARRLEAPAALAFFHIPLPEYDELWRAGHASGERHEDVCCPRVNSGMFAAMHEAGDVMGTFVGHDHVNDFEGDHWGIRLCYGRASGFNTYGREGFERGARLIRCHEGVRGFDTWLRLADGTVVPRHQVQPGT